MQTESRGGQQPPERHLSDQLPSTEQEGSGGEEEEEDEDAFTEPLRDYPRYRKLQDLNRCADAYRLRFPQ